MERSHQKQNFFAVLLFLVSLTFFYFLGWGKIQEAYGAYKAMRGAQEEKDATQSLVNEQSSLLDRFEAVKFDAVKILQALPLAYNASDPMAGIAFLAAQSGSVLRSFDIQEPDSEGIVTVRADIIGNLASLERFLRAIETSLPFFDLVKTSLEGTANFQTFTIEMVTYIHREPEEEGSLSITATKEQIEASLATKLDILKDPQFQDLRPIQILPLEEPSRDIIGRDDPFAPL